MAQHACWWLVRRSGVVAAQVFGRIAQHVCGGWPSRYAGGWPAGSGGVAKRSAAVDVPAGTRWMALRYAGGDPAGLRLDGPSRSAVGCPTGRLLSREGLRMMRGLLFSIRARCLWCRHPGFTCGTLCACLPAGVDSEVVRKYNCEMSLLRCEFRELYKCSGELFL